MKNLVYTLFAITLSLVLGKVVNAWLAILPASLYGMIFYCLLLQLGLINAQRVTKTNLWLVKNMGVCFVPAGMGIINHFELIKLEVCDGITWTMVASCVNCPKNLMVCW